MFSFRFGSRKKRLMQPAPNGSLLLLRRHSLASGSQMEAVAGLLAGYLWRRAGLPEAIFHGDAGRMEGIWG